MSNNGWKREPGKVVLENSGDKVGVGTTIPYANIDIDSDGFADIRLTTHNDTPWKGSFVGTRRSRGTAGSERAVKSGDAVGYLDMFAHDGASYKRTAHLKAYIDGPVREGVLPSRWQFANTDADGNFKSSMVITPDGNVGVRTEHPQGKLHVDGFNHLEPSDPRSLFPQVQETASLQKIKLSLYVRNNPGEGDPPSTTDIAIAGVANSNDDSKISIGTYGEGRLGVVGRGTHSAGWFDGTVSAKMYGRDDVSAHLAIARDGQSWAGRFHGKVWVEDDVVLQNGDCAEEFALVEAEEAEPGTVVVIADIDRLRVSDQAYDRRVAGIVSGARDTKPGILLGRGTARPGTMRVPLALVGRVNCKVDASSEPIEIGDLLTTSPIPGHAMKAVDPSRAVGAIIGKALAPLREGTGMIPILAALQ